MSLPERLLRNAARLACGLALAGCVSTSPDDLLVSTAIVAELPRESGPLVEAAPFSAGRVGEAPPGGWSPFVVSPFASRTEYRLVTAPGGGIRGARGRLGLGVLPAHPHRSKAPSGDRVALAILEPLAGTDPRVPSRDDSPARLVICFHGDPKRLDIASATR